MKCLNDKFLKQLQKRLQNNEFKKFKQKFLENTNVINDNLNNKIPNIQIQSSSLLTSLRRPKNKRIIAKSQSPDMLNTKSTFSKNKEANKQKGIFFKAIAQVPNLHSQDVMNCYYGKQQQNLTKKQTLNVFQRKNQINKTFSLNQLNNLKQLQLFFCEINSLRNLGTGWKIKSLTIIGCMLTDFSGISGFSYIENIFTSYNKIKDLSQLLYNQTICSIDLQGNQIDDIHQIDYLQTIQNLKYLNLNENPIYKKQRQLIRSRFIHQYSIFQQMEQIFQGKIQQNWEWYYGYEQIQLINQINHKILSQKSIYEEIICGLKYHKDNQNQLHQSQSKQQLKQIHHFYNKDFKLLQSYLEQKIATIPLKILDASKSRSKPKLIQIQSKQKLIFKSLNKQQQNTVVTSTHLTDKSFRQTIRAEAKKKFLIRKNSMKKQNDTLQFNQLSSGVLKGRESGFRLTKNIFDYKQ